MKRIVLAVDGSDHALRAAAFAGDLARHYGAEIVVLHVIENSRELYSQAEHMAEVEHVIEPGQSQLPWVANLPAEMAAMLGAGATAEVRERAVGFLADKVVGAAAEAIRRHGVPDERIRMQFKNGHPVKRILQTVEEEQADLIVLGSRGLSDLRGVLQGSVSHRVAHHAPCNVLTVK